MHILCRTEYFSLETLTTFEINEQNKRTPQTSCAVFTVLTYVYFIQYAIGNLARLNE
jgi:hypothetical protein